MITEQEKLVAIRALSNIEGYLIQQDKCIPSGIIGDHFDYIFNLLSKCDCYNEVKIKE